MHEAIGSASDYATLEAALSFLSECGDDDTVGDVAGWRLLQSDDGDLELDENLHTQLARDDPDELLTLSALLAAEHLPPGDTSDYKPLHNPGMMMAMMSAGFPTIDYNPQSLLMTSLASAGDGSSSSSSAASSPVSRPISGKRTSSSHSKASTALVKKRPSKKKPAGYNSNRARDERKEELIYLRKTVVEMETRLSKLQQRSLTTTLPASHTVGETTERAAFSPASSYSSRTSSNSSSGQEVEGNDVAMVTAAEAQSRAAAQQLSNSVWEDIATRQFKERRRAELENIRLKLILEGQIKMAKALEKILKKRTSLRVRLGRLGHYVGRCVAHYMGHCVGHWVAVLTFSLVECRSSSQYVVAGSASSACTTQARATLRSLKSCSQGWTRRWKKWTACLKRTGSAECRLRTETRSCATTRRAAW